MGHALLFGTRHRRLSNSSAEVVMTTTTTLMLQSVPSLTVFDSTSFLNPKYVWQLLKRWTAWPEIG
jgi:enterochelin esterase-like enzyme